MKTNSSNLRANVILVILMIIAIFIVKQALNIWAPQTPIISNQTNSIVTNSAPKIPMSIEGVLVIPNSSCTVYVIRIGHFLYVANNRGGICQYKY